MERWKLIKLATEADGDVDELFKVLLEDAHPDPTGYLKLLDRYLRVDIENRLVAGRN